MQGGKLLMSAQERQRQMVLEEVQQGYLTLKAAAVRLQVSYRQVKRLTQRYRAQGAAGLVHGRRGQRSNRARSDAFKAAVLGIYQRDYLGYGPTLVSEKLVQRGYVLSAETLRLWLQATGLWQARRGWVKHRQRRPARARFGELLQ